MKKLLLFLSCATTSLIAQTIVSTTPQNKKVVLEEFTGTGCPNCPGGHTQAAAIQNANPGNVFVVASHPTGSNYTTNDPMKHTFPAAFYANPYISPSSRYMPSATINRKVWDANGRISGVSDWASRTSTMMTENAPVNVGVIANYNSATKNLAVTVEAYFTSNVTDVVTINAFLTEDGIVASQSGSGGGSSYTHNHVFRDALTAQWGDAISGATTSGTLKTFTFNFNNSTKNYDMTKCDVVAFITVNTTNNKEILNANAAQVSMSTGVNTIAAFNKIKVYPNPINQNSVIELNTTEVSNVNYTITNILGQEVLTENLGELSAGKHSISIGEKAILSKGIYFINVSVGANKLTEKIIVK